MTFSAAPDGAFPGGGSPKKLPPGFAFPRGPDMFFMQVN